MKDFNAVFVHNLEQFHVECLPVDLPERIEVDISVLARVGDALRVRDVTLSDKVRVLENPDTVVAVASAPEGGRSGSGGAWRRGVLLPQQSPELAVERGKKEEEEE
ncbi:MAG: hypothetical protein MZV63_06895 [Marinilabiliales bacterium]|nr:hypothetical protein [Marinilabiliales bacterium]